MSTPYRDKWTSECGTVTLYLGDCLEILPTLAPGSVDAVVTDPPYGISNVSNREKAMRETPIFGDSGTDARDAMLELCDASAVVFGTWKRRRPDRVRQVLIWDKGGAVGMGDLTLPWKPSFEEIYVIGAGFHGPRAGAVLRHVVNAQCASGVNGDGWLHPHEKPVALLVELIEKCPHGRVADPFMGSGTTGVACVRLGRRFIGIELEPKYYAIAKRRIQDELNRVKFLEPKQRETQRTLLEVSQ